MSVWKSEVTTQMVKDLTIDEIALLVADLDLSLIHI